MTFRTCRPVWSLCGAAQTEPGDGSTLPARLRHSQTVFFKHFQTKEKQKWQPYFYKAGRHILQTPPKKLRAGCCGGGDERRRGTSGGRGGHKGVFVASKAWMIVYSRSQVWIARPSHLFKKKPDTSYNSHALKTHTHTNGRDATPTPNCTDYTERSRVATQSAHKAPSAAARRAILAQFHFRSGFFFFTPTPTFCNFWTNQSTADAFFFYSCTDASCRSRPEFEQMHGGEDERRRAEIPQMSRVQILSCEHSYNIKAWCSCCLPLVGSPLPGRFVHFWVLLQTRTYARTQAFTHSHIRRRSDDLMLLWNVFCRPRPTYSNIYELQTKSGSKMLR